MGTGTASTTGLTRNWRLSRGTTTRASAEGIAKRLGVSFFCVKGQVQRMGLCRSNGKRWSPEEEEKLADLFSRYAPQTVSRMMHRGINSVVVKAKRLGYSRRARNGWYTKKDVCHILGVDHHWLQNMIDCGALKASYHHGHRPQRDGAACWHIDQLDLREFILTYRQELNGRNVDIMTIIDLVADDKAL